MYKAIVVDDEQLTRTFLTKIIPELNEQWTVVDSACDGKEALDILKNKVVDLVITDIKMPIMDGIALCKKIHILYPDIQLIILSGYNDFDYAKKAITYNVSAYLLKPIDNLELSQALETVSSKIQNLNKIAKSINNLENISTLFKNDSIPASLIPDEMLPYYEDLLSSEKKLSSEKILIEKAKQFIEKNYNEPISLSSVSAHLSITPNYLSSLFHEEVGVSYINYLTNIRLEKASILLKYKKNLTIEQIATRVGYLSVQHFSSVFKKKYGISPGQYKKEN